MPTKSTIEIGKHEYNSLLDRIRFFQSTTLQISERKPLHNLLDDIIETSKKLLDAEAASLLLFNGEDNHLYFYSTTGNKSKTLKTKTLKIGEGIGGWVAQKKEPLIIEDCYSDPRFNKDFDIATGFKTRNMICVPMINKNELIGVIQTINKKSDAGFDDSDLQLFEALAAQCAVAIENARVIDYEIKAEQTKHEMETAYKIQQRFLPEVLPSFNDIDLSMRMKSAREIGGDYFNIKPLDENTTLFFVADVSGKSIPAALIVSTLYSFLQIYFIVNQSSFDAVKFMGDFNRFLMASTNADKFATAWLGIYDHNDKKMLSINAGHNPVYLLRKGDDQIHKLTAGGLMLGSIDLPYNSETVPLYAGDTIVFYTDGIPEAMDINENEFGDNRFEEILSANRDLNANDFSKLIFDELKEYRGGAEQSDDITLGIIKF